MKISTLLLSLSLGMGAMTLSAQDSEALPITADFGAAVLNTDGSVRTEYPATVTLEGQWADIRLWLSPFSTIDFPSFRVKLQRGFGEKGVVQLFTRNAYSASNFGGPYITFDANQVLLEGEFAEVDEEGNFEDDPVCTEFAVQYTQSEKITVTIAEAALIDEDGNEVISHNLRNDSWKPSPDWQGKDSVYAADVRFTAPCRGTVGLYQGVVDMGTAHQFRITTASPLPKGFSLVCVLDDGDDTTYEYALPEGCTVYTSPAIDEDYLRVFLQYQGAEQTVHFNSIERLVVPATGLHTISDDSASRREIYGLAGQRLSQIPKGVYIVKEYRSDGTVQTRKRVRY